MKQLTEVEWKGIKYNCSLSICCKLWPFASKFFMFMWDNIVNIMFVINNLYNTLQIYSINMLQNTIMFKRNTIRHDTNIIKCYNNYYDVI